MFEGNCWNEANNLDCRRDINVTWGKTIALKKWQNKLTTEKSIWKIRTLLPMMLWTRNCIGKQKSSANLNCYYILDWIALQKAVNSGVSQ